MNFQKHENKEAAFAKGPESGEKQMSGGKPEGGGEAKTESGGKQMSGGKPEGGGEAKPESGGKPESGEKSKSAGKAAKAGQRIRHLFGLLTLLGGVLLMMYPFLSNYMFEHQNQSTIETYEGHQQELDTEALDRERKACDEYNRGLLISHVQLQDPFKSDLEYLSQESYMERLNLDGSGIMGYVSIPKIKIRLPIYHGTSPEVLEKGIGHLEGTSLPVGGPSTHSVLTGHTGLNRAKLFTDLTEMQVGDAFFLYVLEEKMAYKVDNISVIEPEEIGTLAVEQNQDYCTLITCTPYGINSHRLLVRGVRVTEEEEITALEETQSGEGPVHSQWMQQYKKNMLIAVAVIAVILAISALMDRRKERRRRKGE